MNKNVLKVLQIVGMVLAAGASILGAAVESKLQAVEIDEAVERRLAENSEEKEE